MSNNSAVKLGKDAVLYKNSATFGSPTFVAYPNCIDLEYPMEMDETDASSRGTGGIEMVAPTLLKLSIQFNLNYDTTDAAWIAFQAAFFNRTVVDVFAADAAIGNTPQGLRMVGNVMKFGGSQKLKERQLIDCVIKPSGLNFTNLPTWYTSGS